MNEQPAPEAGKQFGQVMPCFAIVVRAEDQREVLRRVPLEQVHRGKQVALRMANHRRRAEIAPGKGVSPVPRVQVVDHRAHRRAGAGQADAALLIAAPDVELVVGFRLEAADRRLGHGHTGRAAEIALPLGPEHDLVFRAGRREPFAVNAPLVRRDAAYTDVARVEKERPVRRVAPG